ncbi:MAG: 4Fe-4S binding protein [Thermodesulfobacteriota bacterium]
MLFYVDAEKCNRDGICVEACGRRLIEMGEADSVPTLVANAEELCVNCGHCVAVCPTGALVHHTMRPEDCPQIRKELLIDLEQAEQFLRSRRSIRNYKDKPVERNKLNKLIQVRVTIKEAPAVAKTFHFDRVVALWDGGKDPICRNAPHLIIAHAAENARLAQVDCILALAYAELIALPLPPAVAWR